LKTIILTGSIIGVLLFSTLCGAADVPRDIRLSADTDSITVQWTGDSDADEYNVYWAEEGETFGNPAIVSDTTAIIDSDTGERTLTSTIRNLEPDTTYEVAVSSVEDDEESARSTPEQITTEAEAAPATPTGFRVTALTQTSAAENLWSMTLQWNANSEEDIASYVIDIRSAGFETTINPSAGRTSETIPGLAGSTRYFVTIKAVDDSDNKSDPTAELIVDIPVDTFPPNSPAGISAILSGNRDVTVTIENGNENMADFAGRIINYYEQSTPATVLSLDIETATSAELSNFQENTIWFFSAVAYDTKGNESDPTAEVSVTIEETESFLDGEGDFDGGCFIGSIWKSPTYDVTENKNKVGVSAGYYRPAESDFKDFYGNNTYPVALFYERGLGRYLSVDLKAGFLQESGNLQTISGVATSVSSRLTMVPVAASVNINFPVIPYVWGFVGIGPDYWYIEEDIDLADADEQNEWIGGYHGRAGFWFYNRDPDYKNWGGLFETTYSRIDRFGKNDTDVGGWLFLLGLFYSF